MGERLTDDPDHPQRPQRGDDAAKHGGEAGLSDEERRGEGADRDGVAPARPSRGLRGPEGARQRDEQGPNAVWLTLGPINIQPGEFAKIANRLARDVDYEVDEKKRTVAILEQGIAVVKAAGHEPQSTPSPWLAAWARS